MQLQGIPLLPAEPGWTTSYGLSVILEQVPAGIAGAWTQDKEYSLLGLCVDNATNPPTGYAITVDDGDHFRLVPLANVKLNRPAP
jgi:hypothetical protein